MMWEEASPAKKTHPSTPYPLRRRCPHRYQTPLSTRSFPTYFFAFRFALNSDLSVFSTFTFDQTSVLGSAYNSSE